MVNKHGKNSLRKLCRNMFNFLKVLLDLSVSILQFPRPNSFRLVSLTNTNCWCDYVWIFLPVNRWKGDQSPSMLMTNMIKNFCWIIDLSACYKSSKLWGRAFTNIAVTKLWTSTIVDWTRRAIMKLSLHGLILQVS